MDNIISDLVVACQDLQTKNQNDILSDLTDLTPAERRLLENQVQRFYNLLDLNRRVTYGTQVEGGQVAGIRYKNAEIKDVLVIGDYCHEWRPIAQVKIAV